MKLFYLHCILLKHKHFCFSVWWRENWVTFKYREYIMVQYNRCFRYFLLNFAKALTTLLEIKVHAGWSSLNDCKLILSNNSVSNQSTDTSWLNDCKLFLSKNFVSTVIKAQAYLFWMVVCFSWPTALLKCKTEQL